ncbi:MAG: hypothetical protein RL223_1334 [Pseudomonadota bacterium]
MSPVLSAATMSTDLNRSRRRALLCLLVLTGTAGPIRAQTAARGAVPAGKPAAGVRTLNWDELIPAGWDPRKELKLDPKAMRSALEGGEAEQQMMRQLREVWDTAPTRPELDGLTVRMPGYVVPLDGHDGRIREFLLVPYFGACIHSPPPPANQIVHVHLPQPQALRTMDTVWVTGRLLRQRADNEMGISGYALTGAAVAPYQPAQAAPAR